MGTSNVVHLRVKCSEVELHVAAAGPESGPLVILLHGFPEYWAGWARHMNDLAELGYRVLVPDQRGYGESEKPKGIRAYTIDRLSRDIVELIESTGRDSAVVIAHDWGGAVAWYLAGKYPERVSKLVILNCAHTHVMRKALLSNPLQLLKSWYIMFFQLGVLPEFALSKFNFAVMRSTMIHTSRKGTFSAEEVSGYCRAWSQPGALGAMINWYRGIRYSMHEKPTRVKCPALILWGEQDAFLKQSLAHESLKYCDQGRLVTFPEATHWIQHEFPNEVGRHLQEFLKN